jgi:hypothetical protein
VRPASAPPALKASGQGSQAAVVKKGSSASGAAVGKKAQPALLVRGCWGEPGAGGRRAKPCGGKVHRPCAQAHTPCTNMASSSMCS